jgi:hypothetical protein
MPRPRTRGLLDNGICFDINVMVRAGLQTRASKILTNFGVPSGIPRRSTRLRAIKLQHWMAQKIDRVRHEQSQFQQGSAERFVRRERQA